MKTLIAFVLYFIIAIISFQNVTLAQTDNVAQTEAKVARKIVKIWSDAHDKWDFDRLNNLYADTVLFYTQKLPTSKVLSKITSMFRPSEAFRHRIVSNIALKALSNGDIKCNFTKEVTTKGKTKSYPSYLVLSKQNGKYLVTVEGDYITDKNLGYKYEDNQAVTSHNNQSASHSSSSWLYIVLAIIIIGAAVVIYYLKNKKKVTLKKQILNTEEKKEPFADHIKHDEKSNVNKQKGDDFETYIIGKFDKNYFTSLHWRSDKAAHGHFPKSNSDPDMEFEFAYRNYSRKFAIECKYRSHFNSGYVELCENHKLQRYRTFEAERQMQVYIVLGVGGQPSSPEELFIIPLPYLNSNKIHRNQLVNDHRKSLQSKFFYNIDLHLLT